MCSAIYYTWPVVSGTANMDWLVSFPSISLIMYEFWFTDLFLHYDGSHSVVVGVGELAVYHFRWNCFVGIAFAVAIHYIKTLAISK